MKWIRRLLVAVLLLLGALIAVFWFTALRAERPVGFQSLVATTAAGQRFVVGVWYPTTAPARPTTFLGLMLMEVAADGPAAGSRLPLVVISHGNGGGPGSHADMALALASAGYVVAAPMHTGDNYADQSGAGTPSWLASRTSELTATIDHLLMRWPDHARIDASRIGAYGFSAGGLTVLTSVGAKADVAQLATLCPGSKEFACELLRHSKSRLLQPGATMEPSKREDRIKAAVVAAPGFGFVIPAAGLAEVKVPVQIWGGDLDTNVPNKTNSLPLRDALGNRAEYHEVRGASHFSFLVPCGPIAPPALCKDPGGFDRKAFHAAMNKDVVAFFDRHMPRR